MATDKSNVTAMNQNIGNEVLAANDTQTVNNNVDKGTVETRK